MIVVDASVVVKWFHQEEDTSLAEIVRDRLINEKESVVIPNLLFYEVANVLVYKAKGKLKSILSAVDILFTLPWRFPNALPVMSWFRILSARLRRTSGRASP